MRNELLEVGVSAQDSSRKAIEGEASPFRPAN
jgi:hypothetical protein